MSRRGACLATGKVRFPNVAAADACLNELKYELRDKLKLPVRAYFCQACAGWHLTSWPRRGAVAS